MTIMTNNSYFEKQSRLNNSKLTVLINNWVGVNYLANSLFKLHESSTHTTSLFVHTSKLISSDSDNKHDKIFKLLSATLGITHIALLLTLISDLILKSFETQSNVKDDDLVNLWLAEIQKCVDPTIFSNDFVQILIKDYLKESRVINREDLLRFTSIAKNYIERNAE